VVQYFKKGVLRGAEQRSQDNTLLNSDIIASACCARFNVAGYRAARNNAAAPLTLKKLPAPSNPVAI
jgi:hypothetical protein